MLPTTWPQTSCLLSSRPWTLVIALPSSLWLLTRFSRVNCRPLLLRSLNFEKSSKSHTRPLRLPKLCLNLPM
ncbi:MAG: hypothetical protein BYD32DRAFT_427191 [Podila humilis]|nr:MAG: hypothetical protein BYD32DRAFT_427191 [Podila humilis]